MAVLNRKSIGLLVSAIALGSAVLLFENSQQSDRATDTPSETALLGNEEAEGELIFPFEEEAIARFTLERPTENGQTETLAFEKGEAGNWQMTEPETDEAEGGAIAFLLSQITGTAAQTLTVSPDQLEEFGLSDPEATVTLQADGKTYEFLLGGADFSGGKRYVRAIDPDANSDASDSEPESVTIHLIAGSIESAINRPAPEWLITAAAETEESVPTAPAVAEESLEEGTVEDASPEDDLPEAAVEEDTVEDTSSEDDEEIETQSEPES